MRKLVWNDLRNELRDVPDSDLTIAELDHYYSSVLSYMGGFESIDSVDDNPGHGPLFSEDGFLNVQRFSNNFHTFDREMGQGINPYGTDGLPALSLTSNIDSAQELDAFTFSLTSSAFPPNYKEIFYTLSGVQPNQVNRPLIGSFNMLNATQHKSFAVNNIEADTTITMTIDQSLTTSIGLPTVSDDVIIRNLPRVTRITNAFTIGQSTIFDTWLRFSHSGSTAYPAIASELTAWSYTEETGSIASTLNSGSYIGFVSNDEYQDYVIQSKITSADADNDRLGIVIAFYKDTAGLYGAAGREYTLSAIRNQDQAVDHQTDAWAVTYNYLQGDGQIIANGSAAIPYVGVSNWNTFLPRGTTIRVERSGDVITAYSTDPNSEVLKGGLTVDVSTSAFGGVLNKFMGSSQIGVSCFSQGGAAFSELNISIGGGADLGFYDEGAEITIDVESRNIEESELDYEVLYNGVTATDIAPASGSFELSGSFFLKTGSFTFRPAEDVTSEGSKNYRVNVLRNGAVETYSTFSITDTSVEGGTTAERPILPANGFTRYNTDLGYNESYHNGFWYNTSTLEGKPQGIDDLVVLLDAGLPASTDMIDPDGVTVRNWINISENSSYSSGRDFEFFGTPVHIEQPNHLQSYWHLGVDDWATSYHQFNDINFITVEVVFRKQSNSPPEDILFNKEYIWEMRTNDNNLQWAIRDAVNLGWHWRPVPAVGVAISTDTWYYTTLTFDGHTVKMYRNGQLIDENIAEFGNGSVLKDETSWPKLNSRGATRDAPSNTGDHDYGLFAVYDRALSAAEIANNWVAYQNRFNIPN